MRTCRQCGVDDIGSNFYRGITTHCRECWRAKVKESRGANAEYYLQYDRRRANDPNRIAAREAYRKTINGRQKHAESAKRWIERNPEKRKAQIMVGNAVRDGRLSRAPCEVCGARATAHHNDYDRPLEVQWLCASHHSEHHKRERNLLRETS